MGVEKVKRNSSHPRMSTVINYYNNYDKPFPSCKLTLTISDQSTTKCTHSHCEQIGDAGAVLLPGYVHLDIKSDNSGLRQSFLTLSR